MGERGRWEGGNGGQGGQGEVNEVLGEKGKEGRNRGQWRKVKNNLCFSSFLFFLG